MSKLFTTVAIAVMFAPTVTIADPMDIDRLTLAGEGGVFGSDWTAGVRVAAHVNMGNYTFEEIGRVHGGKYGIRVDEDSEFGKLYMAGSVGCEPYVGLDFDLNSLYGAGAWVRPGLALHIPVGDGRVVANGAALLSLAGGGSTGAQLEALFYFGAKGLFLTSEAQLLSNNSFEVAGVGWAYW